MNNNNRKILNEQICELKRIKSKNKFNQLHNLMEEIESLECEEEKKYDNLKGGLKECDIGITMEEDLHSLTKATEIIDEIRCYIDNVDNAIENVENAL